MIRYSDGDIFESGADWLVCPVNCQPGVMGAGLAKAFANRWPSLKQLHTSYCPTMGRITLHEPAPGSFVVFLPTKDHWRDRSDRLMIFMALSSLCDLAVGCRLAEEWPMSIAVPALGCGLGQLDWHGVRPMIEGAAAAVPEVEWIVFPPKEGR